MLYPLDDWREFIHYHPWHFWGMADDDIIPITDNCNTLVREHTWYASGEAGRTEIREALSKALVKVTAALRHSPIPRQEHDSDRPVSMNNSYIPDDYAAWCCATWPGKYGRAHVYLTRGHVRTIGRETLTSHGTAEVTYADEDTDGLNELFTVQFPHPTDVALADLAVFFGPDDRPGGDALGDEWQVQPVRMTSDGTTITVMGAGHLLVRPILYRGFRNNASEGIDPTNPAYFVAELELAQREIDTTNAVRVTSITGGSCCAAAASNTASVTATIVDAQHGVIRIDGLCGCAHAKFASVDYVAGLPLQNGQPDPRWRDTICKVACAELDRAICICNRPNMPIWYYAQNLADNGQDQQPPTAQQLQWFGPRRGHAEAYAAIVTSGAYLTRSFTM